MYAQRAWDGLSDSGIMAHAGQQRSDCPNLRRYGREETMKRAGENK
jgi:hypothetical protein